MSKDNKWVIFDLDGTLALIDERRKVSEKENGKLDWDKFFDPANIELDEPNLPVIKTAQVFAEAGYQIAILSGRSHATNEMTRWWLTKHNVPWNILRLRPTEHPFKFMDDRKLKLKWFNEIFVDPEDMDEAEVLCVFDDRQKVVDMWREIGLTCMQVAPGEWPPKNIL
mgnify:FL=1|tara:strand:- start:1141 stop:1644 length:504 start_codon:yes stop_codon:yes gene_type:complete